jgi:hypothetical protein
MQSRKTEVIKMKKYVGVWVDHRQAYVVSILKDQPAEEDKEMVERIESDMERRVRLSGGTRTRKTPYGPQDIAVDGRQETRIQRQLNGFYRQIIERMADADRILVFGPGEAKIELKKEIGKSRRMAQKLSGVETADKMTVKQVAARTRKFFESLS